MGPCTMLGLSPGGFFPSWSPAGVSEGVAPCLWCKDLEGVEPSGPHGTLTDPQKGNGTEHTLVGKEQWQEGAGDTTAALGPGPPPGGAREGTSPMVPALHFSHWAMRWQARDPIRLS